ncbi:phage terminase large subunit [Paenibacillus sp. FSL L8-0708]|uniref:phage terminase large subunit n=1 Tax=Paenibacillus sp. FSL L8-0708 TaxID=2975311 RepID=UPI0030FA09A8
MQDFYESDDDILIVNEPPRHGKSRTASMLAQWVFGQNPKEKVMTGSYNETLSTTFSKAVRNGINTAKADEKVIVYSDIFPQVRIQRGDGAMNLWSLEGGYNSYLATSPTGTATGFGATLLIIDDLIKNAEEASNENVLEKHWEWFTNTMLSRLEEGGKIIIIMTRWASGDLAGRALEHFRSEKKRVRHLTMKALQDDGTMLCPDVLSRESYDMKVRAMGADIASANYQQIPIDIQGRLYKSFKTYTESPRDERGRPLFEKIISYTDTADQGSDFLCSIVAGVYRGEGYVLDVLYTKDGMETTEPAAADMFVHNGVNLAEIESNSGGRGYARNVERLIWEKHKTRSVVVKWFHQSKNKIARILSNSNFVMEHIYYPVNWRDRWPEYHAAMTSYQKEGKNKNDDAPDATTGLAEMIDKKSGVSFKK